MTEHASLERQIAAMRRWQRMIAAALVASILLHLIVVGFLFRTRMMVQQQLVALEASLEPIGQATFTLDVPVRRDIPIATSVQVRKTINVPIVTDVMIDTQVVVPISIPLIGVQKITVPIKTTVPVKTIVPITLDETVPVNATVPLDFSIPIDIQLAKTPLAGYLQQLRRAIESLKDQL